MRREPLRSIAVMLLSFLGATSLLLLCGCSSIKVVETWNSQTRPEHRYRKLMIVAIAHNENIRKMAENLIGNEMGRNGVTAVASHTLVKEIDKAKRDDIVTAVRTSGADAVLTIRAVSKGDTTVTQSGQSGAVYGTVTNVGGSYVPSAKTYSLATLQSNLYDSATTELVWSATIKTFDASNEARVSRDLGRFFLERLRHDGFL